MEKKSNTILFSKKVPVILKNIKDSTGIYGQKKNDIVLGHYSDIQSPTIIQIEAQSGYQSSGEIKVNVTH